MMVAQLARKPLMEDVSVGTELIIGPEAKTAAAHLVDAGVPMLNQAVLLRRVNDNFEVLRDLFSCLVENRIQPYYLFQADLIQGTEHLRVTTRRALELMDQLRSSLSGMALPRLALDLPEADSKIVLDRSALIHLQPGETIIKTSRGKRLRYPEPDSDS